MRTWRYFIDELSFRGNRGLDDETFGTVTHQLDKAGDGGWEAVAAWTASAPNSDEKVYVLFKQPKENSE